ncbi:MAG TPA: condensation domain-containing protein, partial [Pyrinomonadaceae bacterium]|nr:condensation domain-containing protein [Pyrinomonadaceae bacterium]
RGYLKRPELTAERFIPDPFTAEQGARLYKTGDVARLLAGGEVEYVGRADHQVKVRGFRIELGEIESALCEHERVRECVAVAADGGQGGKRLVAYVVAGEGGESAGEWGAELRGFMKGRLPEYMVPSAFVVLEALPLTPNGKVDRKALPAPEQAHDEAGRGHVAPRTPAEEIVAGVWSEVLGVGRVGADDNFFDLGGHSLLATQVVSRLRESFRVEVSLAQLFETPTVAGLAGAVEAAIAGGRGANLAPPRPAPRGGNLPLSFSQQGLWFVHQLKPDSPAYNVPVALRLRGALDRVAFERALAEIVRRHEVLRTTFPSVQGEPRQVIHAATDGTPLSFVDFGGLPEGEREDEARRLLVAEARRPFDLAEGPLLRATLVGLGEAEHLFLLVMHHIVSDGWSMGVLVREVAALYAAFTRGEESPLSALPIQYADYAAWQRDWLRGEVLEEQLGYWRERLRGAATLEVPTDRPRPEVQNLRGELHAFTLPAALAGQLKALSAREGATLFMTLLAAFKTLLRHHSKQADIVVGTDIANRGRRELEDLVGFFVNQLALRTDLSGDPTFRELLARVRATTLEAYARQDIPFELLVNALNARRSLTHPPLFQVKFIMQNAPGGNVETPGLTLSPYRVTLGTAQLDLTLALWETPDGLGGWLNYNVELFDAGTVARFAENYERLLELFAANPDARLSEAGEALAAAERRRREAERQSLAAANLQKFRAVRGRNRGERPEAG